MRAEWRDNRFRLQKVTMGYSDINGDTLPELPPLRTFRVSDSRHQVPDIVQSHAVVPYDNHVTFLDMQYYPDGLGHYTVVSVIKRVIWGVIDLEEISTMVSPESKTLN